MRGVASQFNTWHELPLCSGSPTDFVLVTTKTELLKEQKTYLLSHNNITTQAPSSLHEASLPPLGAALVCYLVLGPDLETLHLQKGIPSGRPTQGTSKHLRAAHYLLPINVDFFLWACQLQLGHGTQAWWGSHVLSNNLITLKVRKKWLWHNKFTTNILYWIHEVEMCRWEVFFREREKKKRKVTESNTMLSAFLWALSALEFHLSQMSSLI